MTNAEIIMKNRVFLMENEVIQGIPGTKLVWSDEDGKREILMPEEIRTFDEWKRLGYMVQKGQHAVAKFQIWMPSKKNARKKQDDEEQEKDAPKGFYKKVAFFFTIDQVKKMEVK